MTTLTPAAAPPLPGDRCDSRENRRRHSPANDELRLPVSASRATTQETAT